MADSFILKGAKTVEKKSGSVMRIIPKGGGDTHRFPQWWDLKNTTQYFECAIFKVTFDDATVVRLVIPVDPENTEIKVNHDGSGNFSFPYYRGVDRVAVVDESSTSLYKEYLFPSIVKGSILTRIVAAYP